MPCSADAVCGARRAMRANRRAALAGMGCFYARCSSSFISSPRQLAALSRCHSQKRARANCFLDATNRNYEYSGDGRGGKKRFSLSVIEQKGPHPRNSFKGSYDMDSLCEAFPTLKSFIISPDNNGAKSGKSSSSKTPPRRPTLRFADPNAVRALNTALLVADYSIKPNFADLLPPNALVPPVPGRADYIHQIADLLGDCCGSTIPHGSSVRGLDIGTGASVIYPLIATSAYGWSMIGSEINPPSFQSARHIVEENNLRDLIDLRCQESEQRVFDGVWGPNEEIDFVMCNPPFFSSLEDFRAENARKIKGLARGGMNKRSRSGVSKAREIRRKAEDQQSSSSNNFGGTDSELWCKGGEVTFVKRMIDESKTKRYRHNCLWFTSLVSRETNYEKIEKYLRKNARPTKIQKISFGAGKKSASILAWTFLYKDERKEWASKWRMI